ncbi:hypothetical protein M8818_003485 [Zalaria obscura]|uniref:Uncharacterized protein n=1 Tax=Zalaria obscura TaxID=2024903 RepID=A0ACC3SG96_9PEZI
MTLAPGHMQMAGPSLLENIDLVCGRCISQHCNRLKHGGSNARQETGLHLLQKELLPARKSLDVQISQKVQGETASQRLKPSHLTS